MEITKQPNSRQTGTFVKCAELLGDREKQGFKLQAGPSASRTAATWALPQSDSNASSD